MQEEGILHGRIRYRANVSEAVAACLAAGAQAADALTANQRVIVMIRAGLRSRHQLLVRQNQEAELSARATRATTTTAVYDAMSNDRRASNVCYGTHEVLGPYKARNCVTHDKCRRGTMNDNAHWENNSAHKNGHHTLQVRVHGYVLEVQPLQLGTTCIKGGVCNNCLLYTSPSPRDGLLSRMPSSA